jgi:hypothetical protein
VLVMMTAEAEQANCCGCRCVVMHINSCLLMLHLCECCGVQVQLRNVGLLPAGNLKVAVSSPNVVLAAAAAKQQDAAAAGGSTDVWQELLGELGCTFDLNAAVAIMTTRAACLREPSKHTSLTVQGTACML